MNDEDELTDNSGDAAANDDISEALYEDADTEIAGLETSDNNQISFAEDSMSSDDESSTSDNGVTQAEVYENLKRIGELEDEKRRIQEEIWERTEQLRAVVQHIDRDSILYKILESALSNSSTSRVPASSGKKAAAKSAPKAAAKATKKKPRRK